MNYRHARINEFVLRNSDDLKPRELRVLLCLLFHRNARTGRCDPSRATIGETMTIRKSHLSEAIAGLEEKGWIRETKEGFFFAPEIVPESGTDGAAEKFPNQEQQVPNLARKVPDSGTRHLIDKQSKQCIEQLSIDAIADACETNLPGKDRRIIEIGVIYTMLQRNGSADRISSFAYFTPEIEKIERDCKKGGLSSKGIDDLLKYRRAGYDAKHARA